MLIRGGGETGFNMIQDQPLEAFHDCFDSSHITLQPKTSYPLKLRRVESGQYLDGRPPGKTRLLLDEVLVRPAGGAHPVVCVGPNAPSIVTGILYCKKHRPSDQTLKTKVLTL